jgi:hypothetical protein
VKWITAARSLRLTLESVCSEFVLITEDLIHGITSPEN